MKRIYAALGLLLVFFICCASDCESPSADSVQRDQQEHLLEEGTRQTGMPNIVNFRERKIMKDILEMRDQASLTTYTYFFNTFTGKIGDKLCDSIGFPIPYATQYTNPQKFAWRGDGQGKGELPQADPNGLFSPASADGTWVLCKNPHGSETKPVYVEPRLITSVFPLK